MTTSIYYAMNRNAKKYGTWKKDGGRQTTMAKNHRCPTTVWFVDMKPPRERNTDDNVDILCYEQKREKIWDLEERWRTTDDDGEEPPMTFAATPDDVTSRRKRKVKSSSRQSALECLEGLRGQHLNLVSIVQST